MAFDPAAARGAPSRPTFNHTREDSPLLPCPECAALMEPAALAAAYRSALFDLWSMVTDSAHPCPPGAIKPCCAAGRLLVATRPLRERDLGARARAIAAIADRAPAGGGAPESHRCPSCRAPLANSGDPEFYACGSCLRSYRKTRFNNPHTPVVTVGQALCRICGSIRDPLVLPAENGGYRMRCSRRDCTGSTWGFDPAEAEREWARWTTEPQPDGPQGLRWRCPDCLGPARMLRRGEGYTPGTDCFIAEDGGRVGCKDGKASQAALPAGGQIR